MLETDECISTGGFVFTMGEAVISWKSKKQTLIAQSSIKSEFFALTVAGDEAEWLSCFLRYLPLKELQGAIIIYVIIKQRMLWQQTLYSMERSRQFI